MSGLRRFQFQHYSQGQPIQIWHPAITIRDQARVLPALVCSEPDFEDKDRLITELRQLIAS